MASCQPMGGAPSTRGKSQAVPAPARLAAMVVGPATTFICAAWCVVACDDTCARLTALAWAQGVGNIGLKQGRPYPSPSRASPTPVAVGDVSDDVIMRPLLLRSSRHANITPVLVPSAWTSIFHVTLSSGHRVTELHTRAALPGPPLAHGSPTWVHTHPPHTLDTQPSTTPWPPLGITPCCLCQPPPASSAWRSFPAAARAHQRMLLQLGPPAPGPLPPCPPLVHQTVRGCRPRVGGWPAGALGVPTTPPQRLGSPVAAQLPPS